MKVKLFLVLVFIFSCSILYSQNDINQYRKNEITKDEVFSHIKYLASDELEGRLAGSNGDILARDYIGKEFNYYNLLPAGDSLYFQMFPIKSKISFGTNNSLELFNSGKSIKTMVFEKDFSTLRISSSGKAEGNIVFAGYGIYSKDIEYNDYKDSKGNEINVEGKIVLILDGSPAHKYTDYENLRYKAFVAKSRKASAMIVVYPPGSVFANELIELSFDRETKDAGLPIFTTKTAHFDSFFKDFGGFKEVQNNIDKMRPNAILFPDSKVKLEASLETKDVITTNIIGYLEGTDPVLKNEVIVIGAHFDHLGYGGENSLYSGKTKMIHHGADDNASGTAGVLELAEKISSNKGNLKRSYLFICFGAEEEGLLGSAYFTKSDLFSKYNIISMLNFDMIGRIGVKNNLVISGTGSSPIWDSLLTASNTNYNFSLSLAPEGMGGSDQTSFYLKNKPILFFFTGLHEDYHKPSDTYDKINSEGEAKVLDLAYDVIMSLDKMEVKPEFTGADKTKVKNEEKKEEKKGYGKVYTGTIPDFSENVNGYKISGVNPDSPAEKAGLTGGDIIIKFGDREIKSITDYTYALGDHKPGDELEVIVMRGTEKITMKIVLGTKK